MCQEQLEICTVFYNHKYHLLYKIGRPSLLDLEVGLHRVVQRFHEGGMVDRGGLPGEDAGKALVAVGQDVVVLVALPSVEQGRHVQAAAVVGVLGHVLGKVPLKVDLFVAVLQPLLPESVYN